MSYLEYTSMGSMSKFITSGMMMLLIANRNHFGPSAVGSPSQDP